MRNNNAELLLAVTDMCQKSKTTITSIKQLDEWQKKLTKLLSDALQRYFQVTLAAKKYAAFVNSLTEKVNKVDHFLQRLELSEQKRDTLNVKCEEQR